MDKKKRPYRTQIKRFRFPASRRAYRLELLENLCWTLEQLLPDKDTHSDILDNYPDLPALAYSDEMGDIFLKLIHLNTIMNGVHRVRIGLRTYESCHEDVIAALTVMEGMLHSCKDTFESDHDRYVLELVRNHVGKGVEFTRLDLWKLAGFPKTSLQRSLYRLRTSGHLSYRKQGQTFHYTLPKE